MRPYVNSGIRPLEGADCHAGAAAWQSTSSGSRRRLSGGSFEDRRSPTGRAREREHAPMMRQSSAGRYDGAPLMCRTIAGADGSARPEQNVYSGTPVVQNPSATPWPAARKAPRMGYSKPHAAALLSSMSSIPSLNLTPSMTFASWRNPRSRRQDFSAHRPIL